MTGAIARYRVAALIAGLLLIGLCVSMYMKYALDDDSFSWIVLVHGWFYLIYLGLAFDLSRRRRWPLGWTLTVLLAGTVPLMTFIVERKVAHRIAAEDRAHAAAGEAAAAPAG